MRQGPAHLFDSAIVSWVESTRSSNLDTAVRRCSSSNDRVSRRKQKRASYERALRLTTGFTEGGALRLYLADQTYHDVFPRAGTLLMFLSAQFEHEVLPATRDRMSIACWMRQRV